jgi:DinB superfamily
MAKFIFTLTLFALTFSVFAQNNAVKSYKTKKYSPSTNLVVWPEEFNPSKAKWYVYNEIEINAKPETVWNILIDAKKWHTFYKGVESPVEYLDITAKTLKNNLAFKMHTMGLHLVPIMKEFVPNERMAWEVRRGNLTAYHAWVIVPTANGCRLITPEAQNGFLTFLQKVFQPNKLLNLHEHWLEVIKTRAEETTPQLTEKEKTKMKEILNNSMLKFNEATQNLTEVQLNYRLSENKWTIAECIEHITLAELEFSKILEKEMQRPADPKLRKKIKIQDNEIQPKMTNRKWKAKSPEVFKPSNKFANIQEAIVTFQNQRNKTLIYIESTKDDLRNRYWKHPLTGKIDLYQTLLLMSAHLERHIEQIQSIKLSSKFPTK